MKDKITTCECLDKWSSKSEITCEYKIIVFIYFMYICLIIQTFWLSEQVLVPRGSDNQGSTVCACGTAQRQCCECSEHTHVLLASLLLPLSVHDVSIKAWESRSCSTISWWCVVLCYFTKKLHFIKWCTKTILFYIYLCFSKPEHPYTWCFPLSIPCELIDYLAVAVIWWFDKSQNNCQIKCTHTI